MASQNKTEINLNYNKFWKGIAAAMQKNEHVLSVIRNHQLLHTQCEYKPPLRSTIVVERLVEEMAINDHLLYEKYLMYVLKTDGFINELYITKEGVISLHDMTNIESRMQQLISTCEFKVSYAHYTFTDITQFNIAIPQNE
eukprot:912672_1